MSWERFVECARKLVLVSERIGDGWSLEGDWRTPGAAYLRRVAFDRDILRREYHVCYSVSYRVPVLYFNVSRPDGSIVPPIDEYGLSEELRVALTQQEHPILLRPFYALHPCKTHEFVGTDETDNFVIKFLSTVAPIVKLRVALVYGIEASAASRSVIEVRE